MQSKFPQQLTAFLKHFLDKIHMFMCAPKTSPGKDGCTGQACLAEQEAAEGVAGAQAQCDGISMPQTNCGVLVRLGFTRLSLNR